MQVHRNITRSPSHQKISNVPGQLQTHVYSRQSISIGLQHQLSALQTWTLVHHLFHGPLLSSQHDILFQTIARRTKDFLQRRDTQAIALRVHLPRVICRNYPVASIVYMPGDQLT